VLFSGAYARDEFSVVTNAIGPLGPAAVFGGLLRDLVWGPPSEFHSDIDLVVSTDATSDLARRLARVGGKKNRYGGFRIASGRWTIDVWPLQETWAFREGHVQGCSFADLIHTTFFNWDAIVLELERNVFHYGRHYFEDMRGRLLEINLEPNANPGGNVIRALRYLTSRGARFGSRLARYVNDSLSPALLEGRAKILSAPYADYLSRPEVSNVLVKLRDHVNRSPNTPFELVESADAVAYRGRPDPRPGSDS
jgi:hypothetical protein